MVIWIRRALESGGSIMADVLPTQPPIFKDRAYYGTIDKLGLRGLMTKR